MSTLRYFTIWLHFMLTILVNMSAGQISRTRRQRRDGDAARRQNGRGRVPREAEEHGTKVKKKIRTARRNVQPSQRSKTTTGNYLLGLVCLG